MRRKPINRRVCPNVDCSLHGQLGRGNVVRHGFIRLKRGRRSYRNARRLISDAARRGVFKRPPLICTDGFQYYYPVIARLFGPACVYGQVMKTWRNNRVIKVDRRLLIEEPA